MQKTNILTRIRKKLQIPMGIVIGAVALASGSMEIISKISSFLSSSKSEQTVQNTFNGIIQVETGETKLVFDDDLLQITIDNISLIAGTNLYKMVGKIDNGIITNNDLEMTQGESTIFDKYIIQTTKIASDYVIFRVSLMGKN